MTAFVLDCSVAMAWCFEDEATAGTDALLDRLAIDAAVVPALWHLEVANVLLQAEKRGRILPAGTARFLSLIDALPIEIDHETAFRAGAPGLDFARTHGLTSYDAAYLELAVRRGIPLATMDKALVAACIRIGAEALPASPEGTAI